MRVDYTEKLQQEEMNHSDVHLLIRSRLAGKRAKHFVIDFLSVPESGVKTDQMSEVACRYICDRKDPMHVHETFFVLKT